MSDARDSHAKGTSEATLTRTPELSAMPVATPGDGHDEGDSAPLAQQHDPQRYRILGEHGRGGLGRVTRAYDRNLGRDIAIKELISHSELGELRFRREALITARLEHPGIVPVHEAGRWPDGTPFYAMKLVAGRPLRALLAERTTVEQRLALLHHVIAVADAIAYAHGRGIIHRDLKPANVIVGDFGETVVIDWGLAKDIGAYDEIIGGNTSPSPDSPDSADIGLTSAGSVLGTPAYMAPEQARGEPVDQRADVFAIGAMLWELCSLAKVPPADRRLRHRLLRRAGIDRDLVAIIDKALAADRDARYPDAGPLAADLKAFKAGARIASRDYSLFGGLAHWARRHRALAVAITAALVVIIAGTSLYVRDVTAARSRADDLYNNLILEHAQALMRSDPSAAHGLLDTYTGLDNQRLAMLEAEARGRGASPLQLRPHTKRIRLMRRLDDGTILSASDDGTVKKTILVGISRVIARDATPGAYEYNQARHLLAYSCNYYQICLLDTHTEQLISAFNYNGAKDVQNIESSLAGNRLAMLSQTGLLTIWNITNPRAPEVMRQEESRPEAWVYFSSDDLVIEATTDGVRVFDLRRHTTERVPMDPELGTIRSTAALEQDQATFGTTTGHIVQIDTHSSQLRLQIKLCDMVYYIALISANRIVYGCNDGRLGILNTETQQSSVIAQATNQISGLAVASTGCCVYAGTRGQIISYNLHTRTLSTYTGHASYVSRLQPPSREFPFLVSSDDSDNIRIWPFTEPSAQLAVQSASALSGVDWTSKQNEFITHGLGEDLYWFHQGQSELLPGHNHSHHLVARFAADADFSTFGGDDELEIWTSLARREHRTLHTGHGPIRSAAYANRDELLIGSEDKSLTLWSPHTETRHTLTVLDGVAHMMRRCDRAQAVAIATWNGSVWLFNQHRLHYIGRETATLTGGQCSPDASWVATSLADGNFHLYNTTTAQVQTIFHSESPYRFFSFSPDSQQLAIVTETQLVIRRMPANTGQLAGTPNALETPVRISEASHVTYSPDGKWLAVSCRNGDVWFYRRTDNYWIYESIGDAEIAIGRFSPDSSEFVTVDSAGRALLFDMSATAFRETAP